MEKKLYRTQTVGMITFFLLVINIVVVQIIKLQPVPNIILCITAITLCLCYAYCVYKSEQLKWKIAKDRLNTLTTPKNKEE